MKNVLYFVSLCAVGALMVALAVLPLSFFLSNSESVALIESDSTRIATGTGMFIGYMAYVLVVFFLLGLLTTRIPLTRRALYWYARERRHARLKKTGQVSEIPSEGRRRGIRTMPGVITRRKVVTRIKLPRGW